MRRWEERRDKALFSIEDKSEFERALAARVHYSLIPRDFEDDCVRVCVRLIPFEGVGGDYCCAFYLPDGRLFFGMCDVMGHSVAAALVAARVNSFVLSYAPVFCSPRSILFRLNEFLFKNFSDAEIFVSFFCGVLDPESRKIQVCGAGAPPLILLDQCGEGIETVNSCTIPLGIFETLPGPVNETERDVEGKTILMYTDGIIEIRKEDGRKLGAKGLLELISGVERRTCGNLLHGILEKAQRDGRPDCSDDILMMAVEIKDCR